MREDLRDEPGVDAPTWSFAELSQSTEASDEPSPQRLWTWAALLTGAGIAARAVWYLRFKDDLFFSLGPDGETYVTQAQGYLRGAIFDPEATGLANVFREVFPPGYPLFVAGIWKPLPMHDVLAQAEYALLAVRIVQWLLGGALVLMTFALARRVLFGFTALLPPLLLTASIALVDLPNRFAYETLLAFLLTAAVLLLVNASEARGRGEHGLQEEWPTRREETAEALAIDDFGDEWEALDEAPRPLRRWFSPGFLILTAGLALSYAIVVQPRVAVVLPFVAAWVVSAFAPRHTVVFVLAALLLPAAWIARQYAVYDEIVPISINGQASVYLDNVDPVGGSGFVKRAAPPQCPRSMLAADDMSEHFEWARCMQREGFAEMASHPFESLIAVPDRLAALLSPWNPVHARGEYDVRAWDFHKLVPTATRRSETFKTVDGAANAAWIALYGLLAVLGAITLWAEGRGSSARLMAIPLATLPLVHLVFHAENRFRVPALPLLAIAVSLGLLWLKESPLYLKTRYGKHDS